MLQSIGFEKKHLYLAVFTNIPISQVRLHTFDYPERRKLIHTRVTHKCNTKPIVFWQYMADTQECE